MDRFGYEECEETEQTISLCHKRQKGSLVSRNITVLNKRTSVRLEPEMWIALKDISMREGCSIHELCSLIYLRKSKMASLTAAIRVFLMLYFRAAATEEGHQRCGHGDFGNMKRRAKMKDEDISMPRANRSGGQLNGS